MLCLAIILLDATIPPPIRSLAKSCKQLLRREPRILSNFFLPDLRQKFKKLNSQSPLERMATKIAQAADELLLNAIFDAPVQKDGTRYRQIGSRDMDFVIDGGGITVSFAEGDHYAAISVTDNFGSLAKEEIMFALKKDFQDRAYVIRPGSGGAGLGLNSIVQSGLSVILLTRPQLRTEAVILFPKARTYKEFKSSFSFFGVIGV
jgi:hypothetical protein